MSEFIDTTPLHKPSYDKGYQRGFTEGQSHYLEVVSKHINTIVNPPPIIIDESLRAENTKLKEEVERLTDCETQSIERGTQLVKRERQLAESQQEVERLRGEVKVLSTDNSRIHKESMIIQKQLTAQSALIAEAQERIEELERQVGEARWIMDHLPHMALNEDEHGERRLRMNQWLADTEPFVEGRIVKWAGPIPEPQEGKDENA